MESFLSADEGPSRISTAFRSGQASRIEYKIKKRSKKLLFLSADEGTRTPTPHGTRS